MAGIRRPAFPNDDSCDLSGRLLLRLGLQGGEAAAGRNRVSAMMERWSEQHSYSGDAAWRCFCDWNHIFLYLSSFIKQ